MRGGRLKYLMKRAVADLLPPDILHRGKRGFGAPIGAWLREELSPVTRRAAVELRRRKTRTLRWRAVENLLAPTSVAKRSAPIIS